MSLVFNKAGKEGATVVVDIGDYIEKANKELKDEKYHNKSAINIRKSLKPQLKHFIVNRY